MNVIALKDFHKGSHHPSEFQTSHQRSAGRKVQGCYKTAGLNGGISRPIVGAPLYGIRQFVYQAESRGHRIRNQVLGHRHPVRRSEVEVADYSPITRVQAEGPHQISTPKGNLEDIRIPALSGLIGHDCLGVGAHRPSSVVAKKQVLPLHDPINLPVIDWSFTSFCPASVEDRGKQSISVRLPLITSRRDQDFIFCLFICVPPFGLLIEVRSRDAKGIDNHLHGKRSDLNRGAIISFFCSQHKTTASLRISTFTVFFPKSRSSSRIRSFESLISDAGTTSSSATSAPSLISQCHRKSWLGLIAWFSCNYSDAIAGLFCFFDHGRPLFITEFLAALHQCDDFDMLHTIFPFLASHRIKAIAQSLDLALPVLS